jgi:uncharacterized protein YdiU (UPF0061 family)
MQKESVDFTHFFRSLGHCQPFNAALSFEARWAALARCLPDSEASRQFMSELEAKLQEGEKARHLTEHASSQAYATQWSDQRLAANPSFVLRNWVLEEVIRALEDEGDLGPLHKAMAMLKNPFSDSLENQAWLGAAPDWAKGLALSCSS